MSLADSWLFVAQAELATVAAALLANVPDGMSPMELSGTWWPHTHVLSPQMHGSHPSGASVPSIDYYELLRKRGGCFHVRTRGSDAAVRSFLLVLFTSFNFLTANTVAL